MQTTPDLRERLADLVRRASSAMWLREARGGSLRHYVEQEDQAMQDLSEWRECVTPELVGQVLADLNDLIESEHNALCEMALMYDQRPSLMIQENAALTMQRDALVETSRRLERMVDRLAYTLEMRDTVSQREDKRTTEQWRAWAEADGLMISKRPGRERAEQRREPERTSAPSAQLEMVL
jgi:hypothetical protein